MSTPLPLPAEARCLLQPSLGLQVLLFLLLHPGFFPRLCCFGFGAMVMFFSGHCYPKWKKKRKASANPMVDLVSFKCSPSSSVSSPCTSLAFAGVAPHLAVSPAAHCRGLAGRLETSLGGDWCGRTRRRPACTAALPLSGWLWLSWEGRSLSSQG